jgi:dual-specificity kinase
MMEAVVGSRIDRALVQQVFEKGRKNAASQYFNRQKRLDYPNADTPRTSRRYVKCMKKLRDVIPAHNTFMAQFLDLLENIFIYDPKKRITAKEALKHPWFKETLQDDGTEAARIRDEKEQASRVGNSYHR